MIKFHYVEETHMMLLALQRKLLQHFSTIDGEKMVCQVFDTDSDMKVHFAREICPRDLKYRKSKTNMAALKFLHTRWFFLVCPRLDQNESCPLSVSC